MPATYDSIATTTLSSAASSISISSIPSTYTDLKIILTCLTELTNQIVFIRFNNDQGANYSFTRMSSDGNSAVSARSNSASKIDLNSSSGGSGGTVPTSYIVDVFSYNQAIYKPVLIQSSEDRTGVGQVGRTIGSWRSTSAVNSVQVQMGLGTFSAQTKLTIFGIKAA